MSIKISLKKTINEKLVKNYAVFSNENFKINGLNKIPLNIHSKFITNIINSKNTKKNNFLHFNLNSNQTVTIIKIKKNQSSTDNEKTGAEFFNFINSNLIFNLSFIGKNITDTNNKNFCDEFFHGLELKSYNFNKYISKKDDKIFNIEISNVDEKFKFNKEKK